MVLLATSEEQPQAWLYATEEPPENWMQPGFADTNWKNGFGGFGTEQTPGAKVRTNWEGADIWLRRSFDLDEVPDHEIYLRIHHDEDAEVYLNGELVREMQGYSTGYRDVSLAASGRAFLRPGRNVLAVHCRQTGGGQYIDAGLIELRPLARPATQE